MVTSYVLAPASPLTWLWLRLPDHITQGSGAGGADSYILPSKMECGAVLEMLLRLSLEAYKE